MKTTSSEIKQELPRKETECVCNANIHFKGRKIIRAAANLLALSCSEESQNRGLQVFAGKTQSDCEEASVSNLCVVTMVTETKMPTSESEAASKYARVWCSSSFNRS